MSKHIYTLCATFLLFVGFPLQTVQGQMPLPTLVKEINPGGSAEPYSLANKQDTLYFTAYNSTYGLDVWKSDGTADGTHIVKDIITDPGSSFIDELTAAGSLLFFKSLDETLSFKLWVTDGSSEGTKMINPDSMELQTGKSFWAIDNTIYFVAEDPIHGIELWRSDGTKTGTVLVADINPGPANSDAQYFTLYKDEIYFSADDGQGWDLWKTNGTAAGTVKIKDINPITSDNFLTGPYLATDSLLFFVGRGYNLGAELWRSNGTTEGTYIVKDISPGIGDGALGDLFEMNGVLYFPGQDVYGWELWRSDGTASGTYLLKDINPGTGHSFVQHMYAIGNTLYMVADDGVHGTELWKSDGTARGTKMIKDIRTGPYGSEIFGMVSIGDTLYLGIDDGVHGRELYMSNGTETGTRIISDFNPGIAPFNPSEFTVIGRRLFFSGSDGIIGFQLYKLDMTPPSSVSIGEKIEEWKQQHTFHLFPNPNNGIINLKANWEVNSFYNIHLHDLTGRMISEQTIYPTSGLSDFEVKLPNVSPGYYRVTITENKDQDSRLVVREKILIQ